MFNESAYDKIKLDNIQKYMYSEEDYKMVNKIRKSTEKIEKEYGFTIDFDRFDKMGLPFIDIKEKSKDRGDNLFATYKIKDRNFSMWYVKKLEQTCNMSVWDSDYVWPDLTSITPNMTFDNYYLSIKGDFFDELERVYYIYYQ
jgi:hypothetical protein